MAMWPGMSSRVSFSFLNTLLEIAWARYRLVHTCSWRSHVNGPCYAPNTGFDSPCNTCMVTVEIGVMNVLTMPLHVGHLDLPLAITLPPAGFVITLTLPCVLMAVTTSVRFWNDCSTLEQMQRRYLKIAVSTVFTTGIIVFLVHLSRITVLHGNTYQSNQVRGDRKTSPTRKKSHGMIDDLDYVDFISSNVNSSRQEALLYVFEDN